MPVSPSRYVDVYLLDDHDLVRQGLRDLLAPARDIRVVGDSGLASTAASAILRLGAKVMVLDLQLQDGSGIHVCRQVRAVDPSVRGLLVTSASDRDALSATVLAGASGFVVKLARSSDILEAVRRLGSGRTLIDEATATEAADLLRSRAEGLVPRLSEQEWAFLDQVLAGRTDQEIADAAGLDLSTAQHDVAALVDRLTAHEWSR